MKRIPPRQIPVTVFVTVAATVAFLGLLSLAGPARESLQTPDCTTATWRDIPNVCQREHNATLVEVVIARKCGGMPWTVLCTYPNGTEFKVEDWRDSTDYWRDSTD